MATQRVKLEVHTARTEGCWVQRFGRTESYISQYLTLHWEAFPLPRMLCSCPSLAGSFSSFISHDKSHLLASNLRYHNISLHFNTLPGTHFHLTFLFVYLFITLVDCELHLFIGSLLIYYGFQ